MEKELLLERYGGQTRLAVLEDGELRELYLENEEREKLVGSIYVGRVMNVLPGMQAAFVDIGLGKNGFLHAGDILGGKSLGADAGRLEATLRERSIRDLLRPGQQIPVQVTKEPGGAKGPRLSGNVTLPGRLAVLLPTVGYTGVSRKIGSEAQRARLAGLAEQIRPEGMGLILRTAAEQAEDEEIRRDVEYLRGLWEDIARRAAYTTAPALLHRDMGLIDRALRDMLLPDVAAMKVEGRETYEAVLEEAGPLAGKVRLYQGETPLFDLYRVDSRLEHALRRKVWLDSGGYLVIDHTEALTVIDVNTGKYVGKNCLKDTIFALNCEAAEEIVRQLRLRDIGGIIVIDFIDMEDPEQRDALVQKLREELKKDRTRTNVVGLSGLGLLEMTRKKVHQPLHTLLNEPCPLCQGSGTVRSARSIAQGALYRLRGLALGEGAWLISAHPEVAGQLLLMGVPGGIRAFVRSKPGNKREEVRLEPVLEQELPPKARLLPPQ